MASNLESSMEENPPKKQKLNSDEEVPAKETNNGADDVKDSNEETENNVDQNKKHDTDSEDKKVTMEPKNGSNNEITDENQKKEDKKIEEESPEKEESENKGEIQKNEQTKPETDEGDENKVPKKKQSGIPLICGSLNWDLMGRSSKAATQKKEEPQWTPAVISNLSEHRVTDVISGPLACHCFFVTEDNRLYGMGRNENGQLGLGHKVRQDSPVEIPFFRGKKVLGAACGKGHSIVYTESNGCFGMGDNSMGQCGVGTSGKNLDIIIPKQCEVDYPVKQAACGLDFTLFLTEKGTVYSSGSSANGQLGINDAGEYIEKRKVFYTPFSTPVKVHSFFTKDARTKEIIRLQNVVIRQVSAGANHCLAVSEKDELFSWGFNGHGRLGHKTTENELVPMRVLFFRPGYRFEGVKTAKCSHGGCLAINRAGTLFMWGQNYLSKYECPYPVPIDDLYGWKVDDMSSGMKHHIVAAEHSCIAFGKSTEGELGIGVNVKSASKGDKMRDVEGLKILQCAAGYAVTLLLALDDDSESKEILNNLQTLYV